MSESSRPTRTQIALWGFLLLTITILCLIRWNRFEFGWWNDDVDYVLLSRSLFHGSAFRVNFEPGPPQISQFPFGFPLFLAAVSAIFPDNVSAFRAVSLTATLINVTLIFWGWPYLSRRSHWFGLAIAALYGLSPLTQEFSHWIMSEPLFTTFLFCSLLLAERVRRDPKLPGWPVLLGVSLFFMAFIRTIGWMAVAFVFAYLLLCVGRRILLPLSCVLLVLLGMTIAVTAVTSVTWRDILPAKYLQLLSKDMKRTKALGTAEDAERVGGRDAARAEAESPLLTPLFRALHLPQNNYLAECLRTAEFHLEHEFVETILPLKTDKLTEIAQRFHLPSPALPVRLLVLVFLIAGYVRWLRSEGTNAFSAFGIVSTLILFFWLWRGSRFLYPLQPQLFIGFILGVEPALTGAVRFFRRRSPVGNPSSAYPVAAATAAISVLLVVSALKSYALENTREHWGDIAARTEWAKAHLPPDAAIFSRRPRTDYLFTGRHSLGFPKRKLTLAEVREILQTSPVTHVLFAPDITFVQPYRPIWDDFSQQIADFIPALLADGSLRLIYEESPLHKIYEITPVGKGKIAPPSGAKRGAP